MKLSQAIREGAKNLPQAFDGYVATENETVAVCALGAACEQVAPVRFQRLVSRLRDERIEYTFAMELIGRRLDKNFPELKKRVHCRIERKNSVRYLDFPLGKTIVYLNDEERFSREEIADWLEKEGF